MISMLVYTGDLGMDDGVPQSVYVLDKTKTTMLTKEDGTPFRLDLRAGRDGRSCPTAWARSPSTGLERWNKIQISRTPGKWIALAGVVMALIGLLGSLFIRPRRVWVRARREGDGTLVEVAALDRSGGGDVAVVVDELVATLQGRSTAPTRGPVVTDAAWESLSNQAVAAAGWSTSWPCWRTSSSGRRCARSRSPPVPRPRSIDIPGGVAVATGPDSDEAEERARRTALFGRLGYLLTCIAVAVHSVALVARGMAADPNRVPWGNMYEFTLTGTFVVAFLYVVLYRRFRLAWMAPIVVGFVLTS